jgi:23S rRNA pseudouridine1911/1915/1917 synthase
LIEQLRGFRRQALHAIRLAFAHPLSGERIETHAPMPADFSELLQALG